MLKGLLQNDLLYCNHLGVSESDESDIMEFTVNDKKGQGLINYIQYIAFPDEEVGNMRTYIVRDNRSLELVGYFSLKAGLISLNEVANDEGITFDTLPGIELANFAVNSEYIRKHKNLKGIGKIIFNDFIIPIIEETAKSVGIRIIYIFALPIDKLIHRYNQYGFVRLDKQSEDELHKRLKPGYDENCIFMYQALK